ncbi:N-acetylmuramoyl-L-alanine amidase [Coprococcus sp. LG100-32]|uniref:N-acetylmuramoyl-L-alanine amidase n=1 Tax=Coprococcus sp. LG100-32 TaxID=2997994 RepID=UPI0022E87E57|nr:N-acetylmuramoyl-L-alanine amidase [Coprococcus sp. LG100-32]
MGRTYNVHAGHCPQGQGASGAVGILQESAEDRAVKNEVIRLLRAEGHTVYDCTCDENTTKQGCLNKIVAKCNQHSVDLDISLHLNSGRNDYGGDGSTGGVEVWNYDTGTQEISDRICEAIATELGIHNRRTKYDKDLFVLANTKSKALLVECCFVDDADDAKVWDAKRCAKAIVRGILNKEISGTTGGSTVSTVRRIGPGSAHLNSDCPIYDATWKNVIINAKQGDHITVLDSGTEGVKVRHNSTVGYMHCKYVMPDIKKGDKLRAVEDITVTIKKGTQLVSQDGGYMGNIVNGNFIINSKSVEKI